MEDILTLKVGEGKRVKCTFLDEDGSPAVMTGATFAASVKENYEDTADLVSKADVDFDKTSIAVGVVYFYLTRADTKTTLGVGDFIIDVKAIVTANTNEEKSVTYILKIKKAVTD